MSSSGSPTDIWGRYDEQFRHPAEVVAQWQHAHLIDPVALEAVTEGAWWDILGQRQMTVLVTREYEHLVIALSVDPSGNPLASFLPLPHPSGLAVDPASGTVYVASTRNPNQVYDLRPVSTLLDRADTAGEIALDDKPLIPLRTRFLPGCLYLHDLAVIGGRLYGNAVGQNAIVHLGADGRYERVWWPRCIETSAGPVFTQNHLQLNSIAAGERLDTSFFSASTDELTATRPGDPAFPVDRRGVIFSAASREPIVRGLTRPHSARLHRGQLWVDDSGYGSVGYVADGQFERVAQLPGWTRGLCFVDDVALVGTSRVIPRFRQYAPGLDVDASTCGVHAVELASGRVLGSCRWPSGNQIFGVECVPAAFTRGFPWRRAGDAVDARAAAILYAFGLMD
jgi:uncharacterized protein (TIGR03032 family)